MLLSELGALHWAGMQAAGLHIWYAGTPASMARSTQAAPGIAMATQS